MSTMLLAAWEAMRSRVRSYRVWEMRGKIPGGTDPVSRPYFSRGTLEMSKKIHLFLFITAIFAFYSLKQIR